MHNLLEIFWFAAGVMTALAATFVLLPLLRPRVVTGASVEGDLPRAPALKWLWLLLVPALLAGVALYLWHGSPDQLTASAPNGATMTGNAATGTAATAPGGAASAGSMEAVLARLEQRLQKQGGTQADWNLLAQTYDFLGRGADATAARTRHVVAATGTAASTGAAPATLAPVLPVADTPQILALRQQADVARRARKFAEAGAAYQQLIALNGMNSGNWADYADVSGSQAGDHLAGDPEQYIDRALALDASNMKALWLKASVLHETQRYAAAVSTWQTLLRLTPPNLPDARIFSANLREDQMAMNAASAAVSASAVDAVGTAGSNVAVVGEVALAAPLQSRVRAGMTLFIVAKSIRSPGMPVAVLRQSVGPWPVHFRLDDSLAMVPERALSGAGRVTVEARVSGSGNAMPQPGDLQSEALALDPNAGQPVRLLINQVVK